MLDLFKLSQITCVLCIPGQIYVVHALILSPIVHCLRCKQEENIVFLIQFTIAIFWSLSYTKWLWVLELSNRHAINIEVEKENENVENEQSSWSKKKYNRDWKVDLGIPVDRVRGSPLIGVHK